MGIEDLAVSQTHRMELQPGLHGRHLLLDYFQAIRFGVLQELLGQVKAADIFKARIVFHAFRQVYLAAGQSLFNQNCLQRRAHGINPGAEPAGAAAHDGEIIDLVFCHKVSPFNFS
jgi:hypothetical protein